MENRSPGIEEIDVSINTDITFDVLDEGEGVDITTLEVFVNNQSISFNYVEFLPGQYHIECLLSNDFHFGEEVYVDIIVSDLSENKNSAKSTKYVEAAKGTNLYFAIYETIDKNGDKKRIFDTIPLNVVIEHQKQTAHLQKEERTPIPLDNTKGNLLFTLSPNDLVYVPTNDELENIDSINISNLNLEQKKRVYKMVSTTKGECHFTPHNNANEIVKNENGTNSKEQRMQKYFNTSIDVVGENEKPVMIKDRCIKLKANRLGQIIKVGE